MMPIHPRQSYKWRDIFRNATASIEIGVEDFKNENPKRLISSVRNLHAGILLLAKAALVRHARSDRVIDANRTLELSSTGNRVRYVPNSRRTTNSSFEQTISLWQIIERFRFFQLEIDAKTLQSFRKLRNHIEHRFSVTSHAQTRRMIAEALPIVRNLLWLMGENPRLALASVWGTMLTVEKVYLDELQSCQQTFASLRFNEELSDNIEFVCPKCESLLIRQSQPTNNDPEKLKCTCQSCGIASSSWQEILEVTLSSHFSMEVYLSFTDGNLCPLGQCNECMAETMVYFVDSDDWNCLLCKHVLEGECLRCREKLTPDIVSYKNSDFCSECLPADYMNLIGDVP